jgi:glycosyltransferase involved in cell wall biosynthesis
MRILFANDGLGDAGGVQVYLDAVMSAFAARGHELAIAYCTDEGAMGEADGEAAPISRRLPRFHLAGPEARATLEEIRTWAPDICYSHNMADVDVDRALGGIAPVVKFMHGYFGTCIGGLKTHAFPTPVACDRVYGPACLALYLPRRCGQLNPAAFFRQWRVAESYRDIRVQYAAIVVASEHMRREFVRSGTDPARVKTNPLFPSEPVDPAVSPVPQGSHVVFLGRMTALKGGDLLIRAVHHATARLGRTIRLTMIGDGPRRSEWEALASSLTLPCVFTGWKVGAERWPLVRGASVVAIPSVWPEPFGLVGLEAGALGVPAVAVDVGGIREWLRDGENGIAVAAPATPRSLGDALASVLGDRDRQAALRAGAHAVAGEMTLASHIDRLEAIFAAC